MKITTITYQVVKNLGNYESERLEMSAQLEEGEDPEEAALKLRQRVNLLLNEPPRYGKSQEDPPDDDLLEDLSKDF